MKKLLCFLFLLLSLSGCALASMHDEIDSPMIDLQVSLGYDGAFVYGRTMPVNVEVENHGESIEGILAMNTYVNTNQFDRYETSITIPAQGHVQLSLPVTVLSRQEKFTLELIQNDEKIVSRTVQPERLVNPNAYLIGVLSDAPQDLSYLTITAETDELYRGEIWQTMTVNAVNFPSSSDLMNSFDMLVIDNFEVRLLSSEQRACLQTWVQAGHILVLGGGESAQAGLSLLSDMTGISAQGVSMHHDVTGSILKYFDLRDDDADLSVLCAALEGGEIVLADEQGTLIARQPMGQGVVYATAFSLTDAQLSSWSGMHTFLQRLALQLDAALYTIRVNHQDDDRGMNFIDNGYLTQESSKTSDLYARLMVVGYLLLIPIAYIILKKLDKRTALWLVYPCLTLACVVGIWRISEHAITRKPVLIVNNQLMQETDGNPEINTALSAFMPQKGVHTISSTDGTIHILNTSYWWYYGEDDTPDEPTTMRYTIRSGSDPLIRMNSTYAWDQQNFTYTRKDQVEGRIEASIWMEEDGFHGEIHNGTNLSFQDGAVFTRLGFQTIPAMAPGDTQTFSMTWGTIADPKNVSYEPGKIYRLTSYSDTVQDFLSTYVFGKANVYYLPSSNQENIDKMTLYSMLQPLVGTSYTYIGTSYQLNPSFFYYVARIEGMDTPAFELDGEPCVRYTGGSIARIHMDYLPVGKTGVIYHIASDPAVRVEVGEDHLPKNAYESIVPLTQSGGYGATWHELSEQPTFAFDLSALAGATITNMQIFSGETYTDGVEMYLLSPETEIWEKVDMKKDIPDAAQYIGEHGLLYVQFRVDASARYAEMRDPSMILEGRME